MRRTASDTSSRAKDEKTKEPTGVGLLAISGMAKRGFRGERHMRSRMTDAARQKQRRRCSCRAFRRWKRLCCKARKTINKPLCWVVLYGQVRIMSTQVTGCFG